MPEWSGDAFTARRRQVMRMRFAWTLVALAGLGALTMTMAQPAATESAPDRAKLRSQVARHSAEVELLQLEHDADAQLLKQLIVDMRKFDGLEAAKGPMKGQMKTLTDTLKGQLPGVGAELPRPGLAGSDVDQELDKAFAVDEAVAKVARPFLDRMRKDFLEKAVQLNEKRLELAELEKRYNAVK
jgi:hypothetical protein